MWVFVVLLATLLGKGSCTVPPPDPSNTVCSEKPHILLTSSDITELGVTNQDQIVLSRQRLENSANLPANCVTTTATNSFHIDLESCDPYITQSDGLVCYTWVVRNQPFIDPANTIRRLEDRCLNKTCCFNDTQNLALDPVEPLVKKLRFDPEKEDGEFQLELAFCTDQECSGLLPSGSSVIMSNYIYARASLTQLPLNENSLFVQAKECWATPTRDVQGVRYDVIKDNCKANNSSDSADAILVSRNFQPGNAAFQFRSFFWSYDITKAQNIFLHCYVTICNSNISSACANSGCPGGSRRRRRDAKDQQIITSGPLEVTEQKPTCQNDNGGCSDFCSLIIDDVICSCMEGRELGSDLKTCHAPVSDTKRIYVEVNEDATKMLLITALFVLFVFATLFVFTHHCHGNRWKTEPGYDVGY